MAGDTAAWNFADKYYEMLASIYLGTTESYMSNDVRQYWQCVKYLYHRVSCQFSEKIVKALDNEADLIKRKIYASSMGDKLPTLFQVEDKAELEAFNEQMDLIDEFLRKVERLMDKKGMILPKSKGYVPGTAVLSNY